MIENLLIRIVSIILVLSLSKFDAQALESSVLQGNIIPTHYKIRLFTKKSHYLNESKDVEFTGKVEIFIKPTEENVTSILLNSDPNLTYQDASLFYIKDAKLGPKIKLEIGEYSNKTQTQEFKLPEPLPMNKSKLLISYKNKYYRFDKGFIRLRVKEDNSYILVTQAQPDNARMIFPCFDEPQYKAPFKISVYIPKSIVAMGYQPLTNTELKEIKLGKHTDIYMFKRTPIPMSSYLVAVVIAKQNHTLPVKFNSPYPDLDKETFKELKTWGDPKVIEAENVKKLHNETQEIINAFTEKFKVGYAFKKLDQVLVRNFPYNGMENFGLIFYEAESMMSNGLEYVRYLLAHELAHQWFGNLVTAKDWSNDFWFQEGAAHYFSTTILDEIKLDDKPPGYYEYSKEFFAENILPTFDSDSFNLAPPLSETVESVFNSGNIWLSYDKGEKPTAAYANRELSQGEAQVFDEAIQCYFHNFKEKNAGTGDLLHCLELAVKTIKLNSTIKMPSEIEFENWIKYKGYPVVKVSKDPNQSNTYILRQEKFTFISKSEEPAHNHSWCVPITYSTSENPDFNKTEAMLWLCPNKSETITLFKEVDWIILNNQVAGYYRVNYDKENWNGIIKILNDKDRFHQVHEYNRMQLLQDSLSLTLAKEKKYIDPHTAVELLNYLEHENEYYPWKTIIETIEMYGKVLCKIDDQDYGSRNCHMFLRIAFLQSSVTKKYMEFKNNPSRNLTHNEIRLKELITQTYCRFFADDEEPCYKNEIKRFLDVLKSGNMTNLNFTDSIEMHCCEAIKISDGEIWDKLWEILKDSPFKKGLISCLACSTNTTIIHKYLEKIKDENLEDWERTEIFLSVANSNLHNARLAFDFFTKNYLEIEKTYKSNMPVDEFFESFSSVLGSDRDITEMKNFFELVKDKEDLISEEIGKNILEALEDIKINNVMYFDFKPAKNQEESTNLESPPTVQPTDVPLTRSNAEAAENPEPASPTEIPKVLLNETGSAISKTPSPGSTETPRTPSNLTDVKATEKPKEPVTSETPLLVNQTEILEIHPTETPKVVSNESVSEVTKIPEGSASSKIPSAVQPTEIPLNRSTSEATEITEGSVLVENLTTVHPIETPKVLPNRTETEAAKDSKGAVTSETPSIVKPTQTPKVQLNVSHSDAAKNEEESNTSEIPSSMIPEVPSNKIDSETGTSEIPSTLLPTQISKVPSNISDSEAAKKPEGEVSSEIPPVAHPPVIEEVPSNRIDSEIAKDSNESAALEIPPIVKPTQVPKIQSNQTDVEPVTDLNGSVGSEIPPTAHSTETPKIWLNQTDSEAVKTTEFTSSTETTKVSTNQTDSKEIKTPEVTSEVPARPAETPKIPLNQTDTEVPKNLEGSASPTETPNVPMNQIDSSEGAKNSAVSASATEIPKIPLNQTDSKNTKNPEEFSSSTETSKAPSNQINPETITNPEESTSPTETSKVPSNQTESVTAKNLEESAIPEDTSNKAPLNQTDSSEAAKNSTVSTNATEISKTPSNQNDSVTIEKPEKSGTHSETPDASLNQTVNSVAKDRKESTSPTETAKAPSNQTDATAATNSEVSPMPTETPKIPSNHTDSDEVKNPEKSASHKETPSAPLNQTDSSETAKNSEVSANATEITKIPLNQTDSESTKNPEESTSSTETAKVPSNQTTSEAATHPEVSTTPTETRKVPLNQTDSSKTAENAEVSAAAAETSNTPSNQTDSETIKNPEKSFNLQETSKVLTNQTDSETTKELEESGSHAAVPNATLNQTASVVNNHPEESANPKEPPKISSNHTDSDTAKNPEESGSQLETLDASLNQTDIVPKNPEESTSPTMSPKIPTNQTDTEAVKNPEKPISPEEIPKTTTNQSGPETTENPKESGTHVETPNASLNQTDNNVAKNPEKSTNPTEIAKAPSNQTDFEAANNPEISTTPIETPKVVPNQTDSNAVKNTEESATPTETPTVASNQTDSEAAKSSDVSSKASN